MAAKAVTWVSRWFWWLVLAAVAVYLAETLALSYRAQLPGAYLGFALGASAAALTATWGSCRRARRRSGRWVVKVMTRRVPAWRCTRASARPRRLRRWLRPWRRTVTAEREAPGFADLAAACLRGGRRRCHCTAS
jgi:hypothetical protein